MGTNLNSVDVEATLRRKVDAYLASIDAADAAQGRMLWDTTDDASHPSTRE